MKLFLAGVLALALGLGDALFHEWTPQRDTMARLRRRHLASAAHDPTARAAARSE